MLQSILERRPSRLSQEEVSYLLSVLLGKHTLIEDLEAPFRKPQVSLPPLHVIDMSVWELLRQQLLGYLSKSSRGQEGEGSGTLHSPKSTVRTKHRKSRKKKGSKASETASSASSARPVIYVDPRMVPTPAAQTPAHNQVNRRGKEEEYSGEMEADSEMHPHEARHGVDGSLRDDERHARKRPVPIPIPRSQSVPVDMAAARVEREGEGEEEGDMHISTVESDEEREGREEEREERMDTIDEELSRSLSVVQPIPSDVSPVKGRSRSTLPHIVQRSSPFAQRYKQKADISQKLKTSAEDLERLPALSYDSREKYWLRRHQPKTTFAQVMRGEGEDGPARKTSILRDANFPIAIQKWAKDSRNRSEKKLKETFEELKMRREQREKEKDEGRNIPKREEGLFFPLKAHRNVFEVLEEESRLNHRQIKKLKEALML
uniref:Uncharacterized protein n=1 Tax=Palpitomonas bilix TaxID=652834 RepID=A0A7S3GH77_9EUKA